MAKGPARKCTKPVKQLATIDQLLAAGMKQGSAKKKDAIKKILRLVPGWTREQCWRRIRHLRRVSRFQDPADRHPNKRKSSVEADPLRRPPATLPWTPADDGRLLNFAGYEPVKKIAQRLGRSERAVRFRLGALGMSAKVTDGWSLRGLQKILRMRHTKLRQFVGTGMIRVRDPRIPASSLAVLCDKVRASLDPATIESISAALAKAGDAYSWERAASLFGVPVSQIQLWISAGQLRVLDTFVTDRSFEDFCKDYGDKINTALMDPATKKWLVSEYRVPSHPGRSIPSVSRARKHALVIRACKCGRKIAGNAYFRHVKTCQSAGAVTRADSSKPPEPRG